MTDTPPHVRHARIAWRCRRGMRELDLLLDAFVKSGLPALDERDLDRFERLLEQPDQDILTWLTSSTGPADADTRAIIGAVRRCLNRHERDV